MPSDGWLDRFDTGVRYVTQVGERPVTDAGTVEELAGEDEWVAVGASRCELSDPQRTDATPFAVDGLLNRMRSPHHPAPAVRKVHKWSRWSRPTSSTVIA
jgi:hypothetical protein